MVAEILLGALCHMDEQHLRLYGKSKAANESFSSAVSFFDWALNRDDRFSRIIRITTYTRAFRALLLQEVISCIATTLDFYV